MNPLDKEWFYRGFKKVLRSRTGKELWKEAGEEYRRILTEHPECKTHKGAMIVPSVALFRVLLEHGLDAQGLLTQYGDEMGERFARIVHALTSIPGVSRILWKHIEAIMDKMSSEAMGYERRIVSEPPEMYGVDILSCPFHELAKSLGTEGAVLCICHMDKAYMKGFHQIRYERQTAVSEGAACCDYRLRFDKNKK